MRVFFLTLFILLSTLKATRAEVLPPMVTFQHGHLSAVKTRVTNNVHEGAHTHLFTCSATNAEVLEDLGDEFTVIGEKLVENYNFQGLINWFVACIHAYTSVPIQKFTHWTLNDVIIPVLPLFISQQDFRI